MKKRIPGIFFIIAVLLLTTPHLTYADNEIIDHADVTGENRKIVLIAYIYKDADSSPNEDFYAFQIRIHSLSSAFHGVTLIVSVQTGICDKWEPTEGLIGESFISFSYFHISFSIWIPTQNTIVFGELTKSIKWNQAIMFGAVDSDFACGFAIPETADFRFTIETWVFREGKRFEPEWTDKATYSNTLTGCYGGEIVPIDKVGLIAPYVASMLMVCVVFVVAGRKFGKRKRS